jgi:hypothetical protein
MITAPLHQPARLVLRQADTVDAAPSGFALLALLLAARQLGYTRLLFSVLLLCWSSLLQPSPNEYTNKIKTFQVLCYLIPPPEFKVLIN